LKDGGKPSVEGKWAFWASEKEHFINNVLLFYLNCVPMFWVSLFIPAKHACPFTYSTRIRNYFTSSIKYYRLTNLRNKMPTLENLVKLFLLPSVVFQGKRRMFLATEIYREVLQCL
jgi:hypothetical protein